MFSKRSAFEERKNAIALALEAAQAARGPQAGRPLYDLTESNPTRAGLPHPGKALLAAFDNPAALVYEPDPRGLPAARRAIAERLHARGVSVDPEHIFLTSGTSEAYGHLFKLLCDPDDEILVPQPSYPLLQHLCQLEQVRAVPYPLRYDGQWHIDLPELRAAITARTRALILVSPNNPTGSYVSKTELRALDALGLPIISDEVFADYDLRGDPERAVSALLSERSLVFSLFGLSKQAALPQWKVSWICMAGPKARTEPAAVRLELIADTYLSVATPTQAALPRMLELMAPTQAALHARLRHNLSTLRGSLSNGSVSPISLLDVAGGFYATLRLPRTQSEEQWVLDFLQKDSVHVQPGYFFDFHDEAYVVLSLLTPEANFAEGVRRLVKRVKQQS